MLKPVPLPKISFEFFPPATAPMEKSLWQAITRLSPLRPKFVSVTYGAGGSTRHRTHHTLKRILAKTDLTPAAHLTCVDATKQEVDEVARNYHQMGIRHIVALRGDTPNNPSAGSTASTAYQPHPPYQPHPKGYGYAAELVAGLKRIADFRITVAAYPETHPEAKSAAADLDNLKRKTDMGANAAITQFFFDPAVYLKFLERVRKAGITIPITPGILPVTNFQKVIDFGNRCGAKIPQWMAKMFEGLEEDIATRRMVAAFVAARQCDILRREGVDTFHFYTLNRPDLTFAICHILGIKTQNP